MHPTEVQMLFHTHKQFEGVVGKMGKSGLLNEKQVSERAKRASFEEDESTSHY